MSDATTDVEKEKTKKRGLIKLPKTKYIELIGIELEGGWKASRGIRPYGDGSVSVEGDEYDDIEEGAACECGECVGMRERRRAYGETRIVVGEICSSPSTLFQIMRWLRNHYPDKMNASCGLHVHTSFKQVKFYSRLMDKKFWEFYRENYQAWAKKHITNKNFWNRWEGKNSYCRKLWEPDKQSWDTAKGGLRYAILNYAYNCMDRDTGKPRKTIECRVLPIFQQVRTASRAVLKYLTLIEEYLAQTEGDDVPVVGEAEVELDPSRKGVEIECV